MKTKKRYLLMKTMPKDLPPGAKFLFQNEFGFVVKADLRTSEILRAEAILISGSIRRLKHPKVLNPRKT
jgi:hypothetical protein